MAELRRLGHLDPETQQQLMADLQETDPALWPALLHQARALAAYRSRQTGTEDATPEAGGATAVADRRAGDVPSGATVTDAQRPIQPPPDARYATASPAYGGQVQRGGTGAQARLTDRQTPHSPGTPDVGGQPTAGGQSASVDRLPAASSAALAPSESPEQPYPRTDDGSPQPGSGVLPTTATEPVEPAGTATHWRDHLLSAIERLERDADQPTDDAQRANQHARLRMLYLAADRTEDAVRPISAATPEQQAFWSRELHGLGTLLSSPASWDAAGRLAEAKQHLDSAVAELSEAAPLVVRNLAFCTAVHSYGCIEPFAKNEFTPEQRVLLYAEVENFATESTAEGFQTSLRSSYQIFDARGHRVADRDLTSTEEICRNRRRDFFIVYDFHLPARIFPGKHTLRLTVEDMKGQKIGQSSIELVINESP